MKEILKEKQSKNWRLFGFLHTQDIFLDLAHLDSLLIQFFFFHRGWGFLIWKDVSFPTSLVFLFSRFFFLFLSKSNFSFLQSSHKISTFISLYWDKELGRKPLPRKQRSLASISLHVERFHKGDCIHRSKKTGVWFFELVFRNFVFQTLWFRTYEAFAPHFNQIQSLISFVIKRGWTKEVQMGVLFPKSFHYLPFQFHLEPPKDLNILLPGTLFCSVKSDTNFTKRLMTL